MSYTLLCNITGIEYLESHIASTITYRWTKNNGTRTQFETDSNTIFFPTLRLTDAGGYICDATINLKEFSVNEYLDITSGSTD